MSQWSLIKKPKQKSDIFRGTNAYNVDSVHVHGPVGRRTARLRLSTARRVELGDKFTTRHGQKGVAGDFIPEEDMPFSSRYGSRPDFIISTHSIPSRMTIGQMIEIMAGKLGLILGKMIDGTGLVPVDPDAIRARLCEAGADGFGREWLIDGRTGRRLQAAVTVGPLYYMRLNKLAEDQVIARGRGPRSMLTRQPLQGRGHGNALRTGTMEGDCLIAYGVTSITRERLFLCSDPFVVHVCNHCGLLGYARPLDRGRCTQCANAAVSQIPIPYAQKRFIQEIMTLAIAPRMSVQENMIDTQ